MSADNGWILRRNKEDEFVLQHYFASADSFPDINSEHALKFDTLDEAIARLEELESGDYPSEYGLTVKIKTITE